MKILLIRDNHAPMKAEVSDEHFFSGVKGALIEFQAYTEAEDVKATDLADGTLLTCTLNGMMIMKPQTRNRIYTIGSKLGELIEYIEENEPGDNEYIINDLEEMITRLGELSRTYTQ